MSEVLRKPRILFVCTVNRKSSSLRYIVLFSLTLLSCTPHLTPMEIPTKAEADLLALQGAEKYVEDTALFYPGIAVEAMRPALSVKINLAIDDFMQIVRSGNATEQAYLDAIRKGLFRFNKIDLDTEDRERTAGYFMQMMDIVGLESSDGLLNRFVYDWAPSQEEH
jgi:hypothetical protein